MKKLFNPKGVGIYPLKLSLKMKLTLLLTVVSLFQIQANTYSQTKKISLDMPDATVQEVIYEIENLTDYKFLLNRRDVDVKRKVTIKVSKALILSILQELFLGTDIGYEVLKKQIILKKSNKKVGTTQPSVQRTEIGDVNLQTQVSGTVTDADGTPLPGANIIEKGTTNGVTADFDGNFSIEVAETNSVLVVSYIGFATREVSLNGQTTITINLEESASGLDEVVVVGYGTQAKKDITGAVATVKGEELTKTKTPDLTNSVAGRLPGIIAQQVSGEPGNDESSISIRGFGTPLIIVDGIQRDFNDIAAEEVESMTVLKDASAAIYGARAGNGVILITTKRGTIGKPQISINSTTTLQGFTNYPSYANSGQYAEIMNEFRTNDGLDPIYTSEDIAKYYSGEDPLNYPNTDWWDLTMNNRAPQTQHEISLRGGSEKIKYFTMFSYLDQQGLYKSGDNKFKRYNVRANLDAEVTKSLSVSLDMSLIAEDIKSPLRTVYNIWQDIQSALPTYLGELPDPSRIAYPGQVPISPVAGTTIDIGGYQADSNRHINIKGGFNYDVPGAEGLSVNGFGSYFEFGNDFKNWEQNYFLEEYDAVSDSYLDRGSSFKTKIDQGYQVESSFTTNLALKFLRSYGEKHSIDALLLYERIKNNGHYTRARGTNYLTDAIDYLFAAGGEGQQVDGRASEDGRESYVGRLNYGFDDKYLFQATVRYDGSPRFNKNNRWGLFPSFSAGWRISQENFIKDKVEWIDNLKLRASYSNLGYDATGNFQFLSGYEIPTGGLRPYIDSGYVLDGAPYNTIYSTGLANPNITWEDMTIYNIGLDFNINNGLLYGELDAFYRQRRNILATRAQSLPNTFGANLPAENLNSQNNRGFEVLLGHRNRKNDFKYDVSANIAWTRAKWDHFDEPIYEDEDDIRIRTRSGNWADRVFGYKSDGLFTSQSEIDNLGYDQDQNGNETLAPGDIKYVDINNDGTIDWRDQVEISTSNVPQLTFGANLSLDYKGFDLSLLLQGAGKYDVLVSRGVLPSSSVNTFALVYENRWNPANNDKNALLPRVSATGNVNNTKLSDFWYIDGTYLRVKNINLGYTVPINGKVGIDSIRLFLAGTNLLTFSELNKWDMDPEAQNNVTARYYPQPKTFSLGLSIKL
tara:strand:+ start:49344 stop:52772 length:3429 start_codon:yes stop_codon:yes gene_type:complete